MNTDDFLKEVRKFLTDKDEKLVQCATLRPEDVMRTKIYESEKAELMGKGQVLMDKMNAVVAELEAHDSEYWDHLYKAYSLPRGGSYTIRGATILKHVAKEDKKEVAEN